MSSEAINIATEIGILFEAELLKAATPNKRPSQVGVCLCLTIAELYIAVLLILRSEVQTHAPILLRAMQETLVNLKILSLDPLHVNQLVYDDARQNSKTIKGFHSIEAIKEGITEGDHLEEFHSIEQKIIENYQAEGIEEQKIYEKFCKAGMEEDYRSTYAFLCSFAHNNFTNLLQRHIPNGQLIYKNPFPLQTLISFLKISAGMYANALQSLQKLSTLDPQALNQCFDKADELFLKLDEIA